MKKKILLIGTGGTISCGDTSDGLVPKMKVSEILEYCPSVKNLCDIDSLQIMNIDSTNMRQGHYIQIVDTIKENYDKYDGFVVTHGTDTLAYTSSAISYMIQNSKKPIVLTGAQKPISEKGTDAIKNFHDAFLVACNEKSNDVLVVFSGLVIAGTRARKNYTKSNNAFGSVNFPEIAKIENDEVVYNITKEIKYNLKIYDYINPNVGILKFVPGMRSDVLKYLIEQYDGLIVESFGVGGIPEYSDFFEQIKMATECGKLVVITTQVSNEGSDLSIYRVGKHIKKLKILEAFDMTSEAIFAKLMWVLAQTNDFNIAEKLFYTSVNYDIVCKMDNKKYYGNL